MSETTVTVHLEGLDGLQAAARAVGKELPATARATAERIAVIEARRIVAAASTRQARLAARSVRAVKGPVPAVEAGGPRSVRAGVSGGDIFFGSEFGGGGRPRTRQFPRYRSAGYWYTPTLERDEPAMFEQWEQAIDDAAAKWGR